LRNPALVWRADRAGVHVQQQVVAHLSAVEYPHSRLLDRGYFDSEGFADEVAGESEFSSCSSHLLNRFEHIAGISLLSSDDGLQSGNGCALAVCEFDAGCWSIVCSIGNAAFAC